MERGITEHLQVLTFLLHCPPGPTAFRYSLVLIEMVLFSQRNTDVILLFGSSFRTYFARKRNPAIEQTAPQFPRPFACQE